MKKLILSFAVFNLTVVYSQTGINTVNPQGTFHVDGGKDNPITGVPSALQQENDFVVTSAGRVGIGIINPNNDASLEIKSSNKGFLPPRVALVSTNNASPLSSHVQGMLVYNTATSGTTPNNVSPGLYFNDGTSWKQFVSSVQKYSSYYGTVNYGDIGGSAGNRPVTGFIVSATKIIGLPATSYSIDDLLVTHNLNLSGSQNISVTILSNSTGNNYTQYNNDNDWFQPVVHDITPNSFRVYIEENYATIQNVSMMIQLTNY